MILTSAVFQRQATDKQHIMTIAGLSAKKCCAGRSIYSIVNDVKTTCYTHCKSLERSGWTLWESCRDVATT